MVEYDGPSEVSRMLVARHLFKEVAASGNGRATREFADGGT